MKRNGFLQVLAAAAAAALLLSGCSSSMTVGKVAGKFGETLRQQPVTSATAELTADVRLGEEGTASRFRTVFHTKVDWEQLRGYSQAESSLQLPDQNLHKTFQCYSSSEKGMDLHYIHLDDPELWLRADGQKSLTAMDHSLILKLLESASDTAAAELIENESGGSDHYLLKLTLQGKDVENFIISSGIHLPIPFRSASLSDIQVPVEVEIEDKTYLPLRVQLKIQGIDQSLSQALVGELQMVPALQDLKMEIGEITLLISNFSYENQEIPKLPMGAAENALDLNKLRQLTK